MKKTILIIAFILSTSAVSFGQMCGSIAQVSDTAYTIHYGRSELLSDVYDLIQTYTTPSSPSNGRTTPTHIDNGILFNIPMKVWVYNREAPATPSPAMSNTQIENTIADLNLIYASAGIRFYLKCKIEQVFDDNFWSIASAEDDQLMKETYHDEWALNMHVIGSGNTGRGEFPWYSLNASFSVASSNIYHIGHEIGHSLGLYHTFESRRGGTDNGSEGKCYQEAVSRSKKQGIGCISTVGKKKCDINGDGFCDTEADYSTSDDFRSGSCGYTRTKEDKWDDRFTPPTNNIMSYWWFCRDSFTANQFSAMVVYLGVYSPFIGNYFSHNGVSFMNLNSLNIIGDVYNGESEEFIVPEEIVNNETLLVHSGGELNLHAQQQINLQNGFHAQAGSNFNALVAPITDCNNTYKPGSNISSARISLVTYQNEFQEELATLIDRHITQEEADQSIEINSQNVVKRISVYPTLLGDNKTIHVNYNLLENEFMSEISIFSLNGVKIDSFKVDNITNNGTINLQIDQINQSGHYILKMVTNKGIQTTRIVINK